MPGPIFNVGGSAMCPHGIPVTVVSTNARVMLGGVPATTIGDTYTVAGCPFTLPGGKPQPCIVLRWLAPATRVLVNGQPVILQSTTGLAISADQVPNGPPTIVSAQPRVIAQ